MSTPSSLFSTCSCFFALFLVVPTMSSAATVAEPVPYSEAKFTVSTAPNKAILTVSTVGMGLTKRSAVLFGDGRLELRDSRHGEWVRNLSSEEIEAVFQLAVSHGLAEWDAETILAKQMQKHGKPFPGMTDGTEVGILLGLESYARGEHSEVSLFRKISLREPRLVAQYFPEIPQYEGAAELVKWMSEAIAKARSEEK